MFEAVRAAGRNCRPVRHAFRSTASSLVNVCEGPQEFESSLRERKTGPRPRARFDEIEFHY